MHKSNCTSIEPDFCPRVSHFGGKVLDRHFGVAFQTVGAVSPTISAKALLRLYFDCKRNRLWLAICFYDTSGDTFDGVAFHRFESERHSR